MSTFESEKRHMHRIYAKGDWAQFAPAAGPTVAMRVFVEARPDSDPELYEGQSYSADPAIWYPLENIGREAVRGESFQMLDGRYAGQRFDVRDILENDGLEVRVRVREVS